MKQMLVLFGTLMVFYIADATEYIKKGSSITLSAGECCSIWSKSGSCISINPNDTSCTISGNSPGTAILTVKDSRDGKVCSTYNIIVYEAKINNVTSACDGASRNVTIDVTPSNLPITNISLQITKSDGGTTYNNPAGAGSTITGKNKNWTISNARWFQGNNECDSTATYRISGTYEISGEREEFESVLFTVNASMGSFDSSACIRGTSRLVRAFSGMPEYTISLVLTSDGSYYKGVFTGRMGTLSRNMQANVDTACEANSQYKGMLIAEEEYHKKQWEGTAPGIDFSQYFLTSKILEDLSGMERTADSESELLTTLTEEAQFSADIEIRRSLEYVASIRCNIERAAKSVAGSSHLARLKCTYGNCN